MTPAPTPNAKKTSRATASPTVVHLSEFDRYLTKRCLEKNEPDQPIGLRAERRLIIHIQGGGSGTRISPIFRLSQPCAKR